ncbi:MAG: membrane protein insertase YidC [Rickettsiales bacterium]|jgi:YidC/Oxa1 family membrane protein insertase|nr:membrane protein insertase YidC [Rickettsiales bacterium]
MVQYLNNSGNGFQQFTAKKDAEQKSGAGNTIIWIAIAILAGWLVYGWLTPNVKIENREQKNEIASQTTDLSHVPAQHLTGDLISANVRGLRISDIELKNYKKEKNAPENIALLSGKEFLEVGFAGAGTSMPTDVTLWKMNRAASGDKIHMVWTSPDGVEFRREISMNDDYVMQVKDTVKNNSKSQISLSQYARIVRAGSDESQMGVQTGGIAFANGKIDREDWKSISKKPQSYQTVGGFVGWTDQYWQTIARVAAADVQDETMRMRVRADGMFQADIASEAYAVAPGKEYGWTALIYAGPKTQNNLAAAAAAIPGIEQTIDYGWFWFLARPFLWAINALHAVVGNYGVAIILFTILLRILMWPLTRKSFTSMSAMQRMQPEMQRIQKQYGNDKMRMQQELARMYKEHGASPMGGCLPMILQIPIFFALYKALLISAPMRHAGFLWISDLSVMDPFFILPIIMGATMWWQQRIQSASVSASDPMAQTQKFMKWMPILFTALFAFMPSGLVLYWTVSNLFGIGQMWWIKKKGSR